MSEPRPGPSFEEYREATRAQEARDHRRFTGAEAGPASIDVLAYRLRLALRECAEAALATAKAIEPLATLARDGLGALDYPEGKDAPRPLDGHRPTA